MIFITEKYSELTNHDPLLKLTINCKAEGIHSFSQRKNKTDKFQLLFLSSNLKKIIVYTKSIKTMKYKSRIRAAIRLRSCRNLSGPKLDSVTSRRCTLSEIPYERSNPDLNSSGATNESRAELQLTYILKKKRTC